MNKLVLYHVRFWVSVCVGSGIFFLLPGAWTLVSRLLFSWNCGAMLFLVLIYYWMTGLGATQICERFHEEDETAAVILVIVTAAAVLSLVAIVAILATIKQVADAERTLHIALSALTVLVSWILVPTMFTLNYARQFYNAPEQGRPLHFPQTERPVFWDFAYFSFTIAAACQTSDVSTTQLHIRKTVIAHTLISFLFNVSILGFAVNITAGLFSGT
jgi:uncharacterized membrane protein